MIIKRYDCSSLVEEKWIKQSEEGKWNNWQRIMLLKTEDDKVAVVSLNIFQRIAYKILQIFDVNYFKDVFQGKEVTIASPKYLRTKLESINVEEENVEPLEVVIIRPEDYRAMKDKIIFPLSSDYLDQIVKKLNQRTEYGVVYWKYDPQQVGIRTGYLRELKDRGYIHDFRANEERPKKYEIFVTAKDLAAYEKYQNERNENEINKFQSANRVTISENDLNAIRHELAFAESFNFLDQLIVKLNSRTEYGVVKWKFSSSNIRTRTTILRELKNRGYIYDYKENNDSPKKYEIFVKPEDKK